MIILLLLCSCGGGITAEKAFEGVNNYCHQNYDWSIAEENPEIMYVAMGDETQAEYKVRYQERGGVHKYQGLSEMKTDPRISRIREMERRFNRARAALNDIAILRQYMDSGLWKEDFEADERGELPANLKRGVLSEDGLWNLLEEFGQPKA